MADDDIVAAEHAYAALNAGDLQDFLARIDPDVEFQSLTAEAEGHTYRGHEGVREWWSRVRDSMGGLSFDVVQIRDLGDGLCTELVVTGHMEGIEVPQRMWQAIALRDGKPVWWSTFRSEADAVEAVRARSRE